MYRAIKAPVLIPSCFVLSETTEIAGSFPLFDLFQNKVSPLQERGSRITEAEITVAQKLDQGTPPENGLYSFSGVLFVSFCTSKKKRRIL